MKTSVLCLFFDHSFVRELQASGFIDSLYR